MNDKATLIKEIEKETATKCKYKEGLLNEYCFCDKYDNELSVWKNHDYEWKLETNGISLNRYVAMLIIKFMEVLENEEQTKNN